MTWDGSQGSATNSFKAYWNGTELTSQASNNNGTKAALSTMDLLYINGNGHNLNGTRTCDMDVITVFDTALTSSNVTAMYNTGTPTSGLDQAFSANVVFEERGEDASPTADATGDGLFVSNGGATVTAY